MAGTRAASRLITSTLSALLAALALGLPPAAVGAAGTYTVPIPVDSWTYSPAGAGDLLWQEADLTMKGAAATYVETTGVTRRLDMELRPSNCPGPARVAVAVDDITLMDRDIYGEGHYAVVGNWQPGRHKIVVRFYDDNYPTCERILAFSQMSMTANADGTVRGIAVQQGFHTNNVAVTPSSAGTPTSTDVWMHGNGTVSVHLDSQGARHLRINYLAYTCAGHGATLTVAVDGRIVFSGEALSQRPDDPRGYIEDAFRYANGTHDIQVTVSDYLATDGCTRELGLTSIGFAGIV